ncbi:unnamed protein product [Polarella glacialis]|uniref:Uncharacterized protein n=1 Tax=Polarella glacialis TaxID=89957 RepID=A0A813L9G4_POLGL|nr:unnamed protein product [Polarella glacialis]
MLQFVIACAFVQLNCTTKDDHVIPLLPANRDGLVARHCEQLLQSNIIIAQGFLIPFFPESVVASNFAQPCSSEEAIVLKDLTVLITLDGDSSTKLILHTSTHLHGTGGTNERRAISSRRHDA